MIIILLIVLLIICGIICIKNGDNFYNLDVIGIVSFIFTIPLMIIIIIIENEVKNTVEKEVKNVVKAWFSKEANNIQPIVTQEVRLYLYRQNLDIPKMISEMQTEALAEAITSHIGESIADYFREKYYYG